MRGIVGLLYRLAAMCFATQDAQLQRLRYGVALAWEVHAVAAKRGLPFDRRFLVRPAVASGCQRAIESSLEMAEGARILTSAVGVPLAAAE